MDRKYGNMKIQQIPGNGSECLQSITELQEPHRVQINRQEDRSFRLLRDKWLSWAQDPSFVEQVLNCQIGKGAASSEGGCGVQG